MDSGSQAVFIAPFVMLEKNHGAIGSGNPNNPGSMQFEEDGGK